MLVLIPWEMREDREAEARWEIGGCECIAFGLILNAQVNH
jgi:hypothetical protein